MTVPTCRPKPVGMSECTKCLYCLTKLSEVGGALTYQEWDQPRVINLGLTLIRSNQSCYIYCLLDNYLWKSLSLDSEQVFDHNFRKTINGACYLYT